MRAAGTSLALVLLSQTLLGLTEHLASRERQDRVTRPLQREKPKAVVSATLKGPTMLWQCRKTTRAENEAP